MSDTDDTDVLLLIPPDFFHVHSDSEDSCYGKQREYYDNRSSIVDNIISQIRRLEHRLNKIEINTEVSQYNSIESDSTTALTSEMSTIRPTTGNKDIRYYANDNCITTSSKSTPQKPRTKLVMGSLPATPNEKCIDYNHRKIQQQLNSVNQDIMHNYSTDADESSLHTTPEKKNNKTVIGEIDQFLNHVKTIQQYNTHKNIYPVHSEKVRRPPKLPINLGEPALTISDLENNSEDLVYPPNRLQLEDVNRLLQTMQLQQQLIEAREKPTDRNRERILTNNTTWKCGANPNTVPDLGHDMKNVMYSDHNHPSNEDLRIKTVLDNSHKTMRSESVSTSDSTFHTVLEKESSNCNAAPLVNIEQTNMQTQNLQKRIENYNSVNKFSQQLNSNRGLVSDNTQPAQNGQKISNNASHITNPLFSLQQTDSISSINLYSLTDLWNCNFKDGFVVSDKEMKNLAPKLQEEKCRRKHCEKLIQDLQLKILEMQQRLAFALQIDSAKDEAILRFHDAWEKITQRWQSLESERNALSEKLYAVEEKKSSELLQATQKIAQYEKEMARVLDLAQNNQEICTTLEKQKLEISCQLEKVNEELKRTQINLDEVLQQREKFAKQVVDFETESLKDKKLTLETQEELAECKKILLKCQDELTSLREEHNKLERKLHEKQAYTSELESQKKTIQSTLDNFKKNEHTLKQELKILQENASRSKIELRNFYQHQVEVLVKDKLKEFQTQLEQAEKSLQNELLNKEQTIARSAAKQMQKLTEKHNLEIQLIEEKHKEEVRLYDLQCTQMKQQLHILQHKLDATQVRRANIAQELRGIMEAQWLEAVRILNDGKSPNSSQFAEARQIIRENKVGTSSNANLPNKKDNEASGEPVIERGSQTSIPESGDADDAPVKNKSEVITQQNTEDIQKYMKLLLEKLPASMPDSAKKSQAQLDGTITDYLDDIPWYHTQLSSTKTCDNRLSNSKENRLTKPPWK